MKRGRRTRAFLDRGGRTESLFFLTEGVYRTRVCVNPGQGKKKKSVCGRGKEETRSKGILRPVARGGIHGVRSLK